MDIKHTAYRQVMIQEIRSRLIKIRAFSNNAVQDLSTLPDNIAQIENCLEEIEDLAEILSVIPTTRPTLPKESNL
jgi:hypothetical protein